MADRPRLAQNAFVGVVAVWVTALVITLLIGILVGELERAPWLVLGFAGIVILSFAVQLWYANPVGFIFRAAASAVGALVIMGVISAIFGVAAILPE